ncbi:MAG: hypothetical protein AB7H77_10155, partial [Bdellovibrionales bacterium]
MTETSPTPLTDQTLSRLRKLVEGNGLTADQIEVIETKEKIYLIYGLTQLIPFCEQNPVQYPGPVRGKERTVMPNVAALQTKAMQMKEEFLNRRDWLPAALDELKKTEGEGWGLDGGKIALPEKSAILATSELCPGCHGRKIFTCSQCQGSGVVVCSQCEGRGQEICYICSGNGINPQNYNEPCPTCNGKKYAPCRFCDMTGRRVCPTCQGKKGTTCPQCQGNGQFTLEVGVACGLTINFSIKGDDWPSGIRRGLDRLGVINLNKGHATIKRI